MDRYRDEYLSAAEAKHNFFLTPADLARDPFF